MGRANQTKGSGRGRRTGNQSTRVIHAVPNRAAGVGGPWFDTALCGATPSGLSLGWHSAHRAVTCPACLNRINLECDHHDMHLTENTAPPRWECACGHTEDAEGCDLIEPPTCGNEVI